jgi:hypothetical protein
MRHPSPNQRKKIVRRSSIHPNALPAKEVVFCAYFMFHEKNKYHNMEDHPLYNPNKGSILMPKPAGYMKEQLMDFLKNKTIKLESMDFAFIWMQIYLYLGLLTQEEIDSQNFKT